MTDYIHWIGTKYYSITAFIREAKEMGVSRRINPNLLKQMEWGDRIFCASKQRGRAHACVFGYFFLEGIRGIQIKDIPAEIQDKITANLSRAPLDEDRGCGDLAIGGYYGTSATVEELADYTQEPMLQGKGFKVFPKPYPLLMTMAPFRGFRRFDGRKFLVDIMARPHKKRHFRDCYYV